MAREVRVAILGDSRDFSRAVASANRDAGRLEGAFGKVGHGLASFAKTAAIGTAAVVAGGIALGKSFVDAAYESQKVTAQTGAVIKSMGLSARASAEDVAKLATKLSLKTGIDDELIQSGSNVLLTFGEVAKQVGSSTKIFDRANAAALDMSVALGTDMNSAAMQVGKALNDPIRGLTALRRSGIQFTAQQEEQIKTMVEAGDVAGAQTVMLAELEKQFGGSAEAQATAADRLKVAWGNVQEQLGAALIPILEKVASFLADNLPGAMAKAQEFMDNTLKPAFERTVAFVQEHWPKVRDTIVAAVEHIKAVVTPIVGALQALWENFGNNILTFMQRVWPAIQQVIQGAMNIIQGIIKTVTALIQGDWSTVWEGIKQIFSGVWQGIQGILRTALELLRGALGIGLEIIGSVFKGAWTGLVNWFASLPGTVGQIAAKIWMALREGLRAAVDWILRQLDRILGPLDEIAGKVSGVIGKLGGVAGKVGGALGNIPGLAAGGTALANRLHVVGENGPELFVPGRTGTVVPNHALGGGPSVQIIIQTGADPQAVVEAIKRYTRSNGPLPASIVG